MSASKGRRRSFLMNDVSEVNMLLNNAWDQKFEQCLRPRPKIWIMNETETKQFLRPIPKVEQCLSNQKNDPKVTWGNTCGRGRSVLFKRSFQATEEEEDSKDEDDDDNPRRRAVRRFDSDSLIQSIAAYTCILHMFETEYLEFQPNIKKCPTLKESLQKIEFSSKKHWPSFEDFVLWPKPKVSETKALWAGTPPSTYHESSYPATGKAPSGERNFSPSFCKRWTFKTRLLFCECLGDTRS